MSDSEQLECPPLAVRWMRPKSSTAHLELPTAPIALTSQKDVVWIPFTVEESLECEAAWASLSDDEHKRACESNRPESSEISSGEEEDEEFVGVSIAEDKLFEIDVRSMTVGHHATHPLC